MKRMLTVRVAFHERVRTGVAAPADDLGKLWTQCRLSPAAEPDSPHLDLVLFDRPHDGVHGLDRKIVRRPFATQETRIEALQARWTPERAGKRRFHMQVPDPVDAAERPSTLLLNPVHFRPGFSVQRAQLGVMRVAVICLEVGIERPEGRTSLAAAEIRAVVQRGPDA